MNGMCLRLILFCFHIYIISCLGKLSKVKQCNKASCWGKKTISFRKDIKWVMRVKAQDARLCFRHAELSLAWGFGSRDGGMGRAREGRLARSLVPDWLGPRPRHLWPRLPPAHTQCSKHVSGKRSYVFWSCHIISISVLYKLKAVCRFVVEQ